VEKVETKVEHGAGQGLSVDDDAGLVEMPSSGSGCQATDRLRGKRQKVQVEREPCCPPRPVRFASMCTAHRQYLTS
jgi:hypothetical protein